MKIINPPVKLCRDILEFLYEFNSRNKECNLRVVEKYFNVSSSYLSLALLFLNNQGIISIDNSIIALSPKAKTSLDKSLTNVRKIILEQLMSFQPFIEFTYFLGKGKSDKDSARLVKSLYGLEHEEILILKVFRAWIKLLDIKILKTPSKNKTIDGIKESLQNKLYANNFIKEFLKDDLRNISEQVIAELSDAIKEIPEDNEASVNEAGKALEDFLRIDLANDIDLTHCSGIGEIGNELNKYTHYPKKLNNLCVGLSNIRSMGKAHGSDKTLKTKWAITEQSAIGYVIIVLSILKSYLIFKKESKLIF